MPIQCMVPGCTHDTKSPHSGKDGYVCGPHWFRLTLETRRLWWKDTDLGKRPPSREMRAMIIAELTGATQR